MNWRTLVDLAGFQLVWWACALGAGYGRRSTPGILAAALFLAIQMAIRGRSPTFYRTILAAGLIGFAGESLLVATGLVRYAAPWPSEHLAPAWIVALWLSFGTTLEIVRQLVGSRPILTGALLGAVLGPVAYCAAAHLGALTFPAASELGLLVIAALWGLALPTLLTVQARSSKAHRPRWWR